MTGGTEIICNKYIFVLFCLERRMFCEHFIKDAAWSKPVQGLPCAESDMDSSLVPRAPLQQGEGCQLTEFFTVCITCVFLRQSSVLIFAMTAGKTGEESVAGRCSSHEGIKQRSGCEVAAAQ